MNHNPRLIKEVLAILGDAMPRISIYCSAMEDGAEKQAVAEILSCVERNVPTLTGRPFWVDGPAQKTAMAVAVVEITTP